MVSNNLHEKSPAELERVLDEVHSRLGRAYGRSKADIAKLAFKRYGGNDMTERTDEIVANARNFLGSGREDAMDKMMKWEMIRDMRAQRNNPPPQNHQQYSQEQPLQQPRPPPMQMQDMMMYPMMMMMIKGMAGGGGEDDIMKIFKLKMLMGDGDGKGMDLEKMEQMFKEERAASEERTQQLINSVFGRQEAEKLQAEEARYKRELEQRVQNAEYLARHPTTPQEPLQSAKQKLDESLEMMVDMKSKMEGAGMVHTPPTPEDKKFELDKMDIGHKQGVESKAVDSMAKSVEKMSDTVNNTTNKIIDLVAKEQEVKATHLKMQTPEGQEQLQRNYENLADRVIQEQGTEPVGSRSDVEFTDEDDLDATD